MQSYWIHTLPPYGMLWWKHWPVCTAHLFDGLSYKEELQLLPQLAPPCFEPHCLLQGPKQQLPNLWWFHQCLLAETTISFIWTWTSGGSPVPVISAPGLTARASFSLWFSTGVLSQTQSDFEKPNFQRIWWLEYIWYEIMGLPLSTPLLLVTSALGHKQRIATTCQ